MTGALATTVRGPARPPFGLCALPLALDTALVALEHGAGIDRDIDAAIYAALGWEVDRGLPRRAAARRRLAWRCRSPLSAAWEALPSPTDDIGAAARLVPWKWSWGTGIDRGHARAWCREDRARQGRPPRFAECNRLTPARALAAAALFAHRQIALEADADA